MRARRDGRDVFIKTSPRPGPAVEAEGLRRMAQAGVRVPDILAVDDDRLVLAWLAPGAPRWDEAGRMLAALHAVVGPHHGLDHDNFMGGVPQPNAPASDPRFVTFFRERRLASLAPLLPARTRARLDAVRFEDILSESPPRLVHGDLWSGNLVHAEQGPTYIDPALHFGHPEGDLAMTRLFGGFPPAFEAAWREAMGPAWRPDREFPRRVAALQLYPLLIHLRLFGEGYLRDIEDRLDQLA